MQVILEKPTPWLASPLDGHRNRLMYSELASSISERYHTFKEEPINFRTEFVQRSADHDSFRLSYHSVGDNQNVWRIKETPVPYFYSYDRLGFSGWSEIAQHPEQFRNAIDNVPTSIAENYVISLENWLISNNFSKYQQSKVQEINLPDNFIFLPLQVRSDIVSQFCSIDPILVAIKLAKLAKKKQQYLYIKRHPLCKSKKNSLLLRFLAINNPYVVISNASVNQLLPKCSTVVVANSGVGFEALIHKKRVLSFAKSEYTIACEYFDTLANLEKLLGEEQEPMDSIFSQKYIYYYLNNLCFDARKKTSIHKMLNLAEYSLHNKAWRDRLLIDIHKAINFYD